jgi:[NiFe] hydrogenase assembly HybE family chaperone
MYPAVDKLVIAYRDSIQPRMRALPMYNPALEMEAVGFELHDGRPCGVLITPWFMNLILLPGEDDNWSGLAQGKTIKVAFPAGDYPCMVSAPEGIVPHLSLPLYTTVKDFTDQGTACRVASDILQRLHRNTEDPIQAARIDTEMGTSKFQQPLSRRALLLGWLSPGGGEK